MRGRGGPAASGWILPLLFLLPPAGNLIRPVIFPLAPLKSPSSLGGASEKTAGGAAEPAPELETALLRELLREKERELQLLRPWSQDQPRYVPLRAEVLPLADLSPRRSALWLWTEGLHGVSARTAVAYRGALVGSVEKVWADRGLARVQTLLDPYFRVKFRYGEAWGFLGGTGTFDGEGNPILEIRHLRVEVAFREGERVFTAGDDGFYPVGIPIGKLFRRPDGSGPARFEVHGEIPVDRIHEAVLLVDRAGAEVRSLPGKGAAE